MKKKLSDFFVNVATSYYMSAFITPGFFGKDLVKYYVVFLYYLILAIIYFILAIKIYSKTYEQL
ncbi:MAG: hypothetical protein ACD_26C00134G0007 [uncultured bacterium]|nr:MAG: hypothetical protein ACD_26C00134G0007 [uncultured bacterium]